VRVNGEETGLTVRTTGADETRAVGAALGRLLAAGDVVLLQGELGAGKTTLVQGLARGAGSDELVQSPSFILVNEYRGRVKVYHADLYRITHPDEALALDLLGSTLDGVLVVEWPERGDGALPPEHVLVRIAVIGPDERELRFEARGARPAEVVRALAAALAQTVSERSGRG
jgi:tRNA threonylcarbamoyladenosine biosynthesis protein TsaE